MATATRNLSDCAKTQNLSASAKTKKWLVRNEAGETFGPVDFETLKGWASDGRLAPTNEISDNGADWQIATALGGLAMDWVAEVTPGTFYGPIHKAAMAELVKDGSLPACIPIFMRHTLSERPAPATVDPQVERLRKQLAEQAETHAAELAQMRRQASAEADSAKRQTAAREAELEKARQQMAAQVKQQAAAAAVELGQARHQAAEAKARAELAARQTEAMAAELEAVRREKDEAEAHADAVRQHLSEEAEQAKQQSALVAGELEAVRRQADDAEALAAAVRQQMSVQAEQARAAQQQLSEKMGELDRKLAQACQEQAAVVARLTAARAENEARASAWAAKERAFETERQALRSEVGRAQAETSAREQRVLHLESALAEAGRAVQDGQAVEAQVRVLRTELELLRSTLKEDRLRAQAAQAQCATLTDALADAQQGRSGEARRVAELQGDLTLAREQLVGLRARVSQLQSAPAVVETLEAEPMEPVARPHERPKHPPRPVLEAEVLPPERPRPAGKPPVAKHADHAKPGLSMADLEQQARRELERLGTQGTSFFKKKR